MTVITLPFPPPDNNLFLNAKGRGRIKAPRYRQWEQLAGLQLLRQSPEPVKGSYHAVLEVERIDRRRRDISNTFKAVSDLLVTHGVIDDDSFAEKVTLEWAEGIEGCRVTITPCAEKGRSVSVQAGRFS